MGRDRDFSSPENGEGVAEDREYKRKPSLEDSGEEDVKRRETRRRSKGDKDSGSGSGLGSDAESESEEERRRSRKARGKRKSRRRRGRDDDDDSDSGSDSESESDYSSEYSDSEESESEEERRRRKRKQRKRREKEERERKRRRREEKKRRRGDKEEEGERKRKKKEKMKKKKERMKKKKEKSEKGKKGAVTNSWGKYGIIRETDMWNKRPEFTAWLAEIKQVNLESLPPWEEKKMFKEFMEDHNTATFPSKKYYDIDGYFRRKMEKEMKKGVKKVVESERTVFNDEEQRRLELQQEREKQKEAEVLALKRSMEGGMAQAMREQARLKEEMAYLYKIGNIEAAAAIQRRLDPDVAM